MTDNSHMLRNESTWVLDAMTLVKTNVAPLPPVIFGRNIVQFRDVAADESIGCHNKLWILERAIYIYFKYKFK